MPTKLSRFAALCCLLCALIIIGRFPAMAQSDTKGAMRIKVHEEDKPEVGIAKAQVTIINKRTGIARTLPTNAVGVCLFDLIDPVEYDITAKADGYVETLYSKVSDFKVVF